MRSSEYSEFYKLSVKRKIKRNSRVFKLSNDQMEVFKNANSLSEEVADNMVENVIGRFSLPVGVAINFHNK